jgi:hypothetical protein
METKPRLTPHAKLIDFQEAEQQSSTLLSTSTLTELKPRLKLPPHVPFADWEEDVRQPVIVPPITPQPAKEEQKISVIVPSIPWEERILPTVPAPPREKPREEPLKIPAILPSILPRMEQTQQTQTPTPPILTPPTPTPQKPGPLPRFGSRDEGIRAPDFGRLLFGGKYVKRHEIALPSQIAKQVLTVSAKGKRKTGIATSSSLIFGKQSRRGAGLGGSFSSFVLDVGGRRRGSGRSLLRGSLAEVVFG